MTDLVVYDAGALLAAERDERRFRDRHQAFLRSEHRLLVPAPVLAQVWRGGNRQVGLSRVLRGCEVVDTTEDTARHAGVLLAGSRTSDAVDAIVAATALRRRAALVVTSDPDDLDRLFVESWRPGLLVV